MAPGTDTHGSKHRPPPKGLKKPPSTTLVNPYKKKKPVFVGGAERARQKARKGRGIPISRPTDDVRNKAILPPKMNSFERFFASLLRSSPSEYPVAGTSDTKALELWKTICGRVNLGILTSPVQASYAHPRDHFEARAALVLEEARNALSQPLARKWGSNNNNKNGKGAGPSMFLSVHHLQPTATNHHTKVFLSNSKRFTKAELFNIRPGTVFECLPRDETPSIHNVMLGVAVSGNRDAIEKKGIMEILLFRDIPGGESCVGTDWVVSCVATLLSEYRCFDAMTRRPESVGFMTTLLGGKRATHVRFGGQEKDGVDDDDAHVPQGAGTQAEPVLLDLDDDGGEENVNEDDVVATVTPANSPQPAAKLIESDVFNLPRLNDTQSVAANTFLTSDQNSVTLVQGPPGTGKTTLLSSIICQYLMEDQGDNKRRLMVCAPTNKAVSVLASRFLACVKGDKQNLLKAIMVGDADKLLVDEKSSTQNGSSTTTTHIMAPSEGVQLGSIFLYTWMQSVMTDYRKIRHFFLPGGSGLSHGNSTNALQIARNLENRLNTNLPSLPKAIYTLAARVVSKLDPTSSSSGDSSTAGIVDVLDNLLKELKAISTDQVWKDLLAGADVIFCTLASSGGGVFRNMPPINDLIVDEAAAATEPEICIPFLLKPTRLLAVGDPLQLPATVLSRRAIDLGLAKSLHERLMYDCNYDHIMLDVQYRMNPAISVFPSDCFYKSKITNGENVIRGAAYREGPKLLNRLPYTFLQVHGAEEQGRGGSCQNQVEARAVVAMILQLRQLARNQNRPSSSGSWYSSDRVRVITFYQAQVGLIKRLLTKEGLGDKIVVATVDSSQGCEADLVIVSFVRSNKQAGFLTDDRRMNVALTRAKYQLICIGNFQAMPSMTDAKTLHLLAANADARNVIQVYEPLSEAKRAANSGASAAYGGPKGPKQPRLHPR